MKNLLKILLLSTLLFLSNVEAKDKIDISPSDARKYDEKFAQVSIRRKGLDDGSIENLKNPVIRDIPEAPYVEPLTMPQEELVSEPEVIPEPVEEVQEEVAQAPEPEAAPEPIPEPPKEYTKYKISGVVSNKVKIDGVWYTIGDKIGDEYFRAINTKEIVLSDKDNKNQREIKVERGLPNAKKNEKK